jgi:hypothetical protein
MKSKYRWSDFGTLTGAMTGNHPPSGQGYADVERNIQPSYFGYYGCSYALNADFQEVSIALNVAEGPRGNSREQRSRTCKQTDTGVTEQASCSLVPSACCPPDIRNKQTVSFRDKAD